MVSVAPVITSAGKSLTIRAIAGEPLVFTRFKIGNGTVPTGTEWSALTDLVSSKLAFGITSIATDSDGIHATVTGVFDSAQVTETFKWKELGLFCKGGQTASFNGDGTTKSFTISAKPDFVAKVEVSGVLATVSSYNSSTGVVTLSTAPAAGTNNVVVTYPWGSESLYAYANDGDDAGTLKANISDVVVEQTVSVIIATGAAANVTAIISASAMYALKTDFDAHVADTDNPHEVTKSQVGLSNVPNVTTNNQTPTYSMAASNTNLTSGETLTVALGKIAKAISSLISHLASRSNPHSVTLAQVAGTGYTNNIEMLVTFSDGTTETYYIVGKSI